MAKIRIITIFAKLIINKMAETDWFFEYITDMEVNPLLINSSFEFKMNMGPLTDNEYEIVIRKLCQLTGSVGLNLFLEIKPQFLWVNDGLKGNIRCADMVYYFNSTLNIYDQEYPELSPFIFLY
jgi:hypothetical protein